MIRFHPKKIFIISNKTNPMRTIIIFKLFQDREPEGKLHIVTAIGQGQSDIKKEHSIIIRHV